MAVRVDPAIWRVLLRPLGWLPSSLMLGFRRNLTVRLICGTIVV